MAWSDAARAAAAEARRRHKTQLGRFENFVRKQYKQEFGVSASAPRNTRINAQARAHLTTAGVKGITAQNRAMKAAHSAFLQH